VGTLTGAALILGVRLSATAAPIAAPPAFDAQQVGATEKPRASPSPAARARDRDRDTDDDTDEAAEPERTRDREESDEQPEREREQSPSDSGLRDGQFTGAAASNPYGKVQVAITVSNGRITAAAATYPTTGESASINANAIPKLKQSTVQAQGAEVDAVSGATFTTESYVKSLQGALDAARS
jgi:uncharacterized protein with FMN-binding domain